MLMAVIMALSLAACGGSAVTGGTGLDDVAVGDEITAPAPEGFIGRYTGQGDKDDDSDDDTALPEAKASKAMKEKALKPYGELITLVKSVDKPTKPDSKNVKDTDYGKVDWSMAAQGYDKAGKVGTIDVYVDPDKIIESEKGVCNEMSKLLVAMLRSQGIPAYMQNGTNRNGQSHGWVMAWVELSSETKNSTTYSTGTWILIEATGGGLQPKVGADKNYTPDSIKG